MADLNGFWSYVHDDDDADGGRASRLAKDVVAQFEMLTGEKIEVFLDRDDIAWGEVWRNKIDESLATVAFFIPVLTPRYFKSPECRRELQFFARRAKNLGIQELVLPLLYVDVLSLHEDAPSDDLLALVKTFQWEDWRELRFADVHSAEYRRGVARLAQRLVEANRRAEEANVAAAARELESAVGEAEDSDDSPGRLDLLAAAEDTLPQWLATLEGITREITSVGDIVGEAGEEMKRGDSRGKGFAARLTTARKLARSLREPTENIYSLGNTFASQLHQIDPGFRAIIGEAPSEIRDDPEAQSGLCGFFQSIRQLSASAEEALQSLQGMIDAASPGESLSRDLRNPLRRLRQGLTLVIEGREVIDEWVALIEDTGIDCDGVAGATSP